MALLRRLIPDTNARIQEELVWLRLTVDSPRGVPDAQRAHMAAQLRVVVDGLSLAVCTGRLAPEEALEQLRTHLAGT